MSGGLDWLQTTTSNAPLGPKGTASATDVSERFFGPQPIENRLKESEWIAEAVLFGDGAEYVFGLIVPNFERLRAHLETLGIRPPTDEDLVASEKVRELIKAAVQHVNSESADFEKVKKHALVAARFTVESGDLTPTLKVRRKVVREKYADLLSTLRKP